MDSTLPYVALQLIIFPSSKISWYLMLHSATAHNYPLHENCTPVTKNISQQPLLQPNIGLSLSIATSFRLVQSSTYPLLYHLVAEFDINNRLIRQFWPKTGDTGRVRQLWKGHDRRYSPSVAALHTQPVYYLYLRYNLPIFLVDCCCLSCIPCRSTLELRRQLTAEKNAKEDANGKKGAATITKVKEDRWIPSWISTHEEKHSDKESCKRTCTNAKQKGGQSIQGTNGSKKAKNGWKESIITQTTPQKQKGK